MIASLSRLSAFTPRQKLTFIYHIIGAECMDVYQLTQKPRATIHIKINKSTGHASTGTKTKGRTLDTKEYWTHGASSESKGTGHTSADTKTNVHLPYQGRMDTQQHRQKQQQKSTHHFQSYWICVNREKIEDPSTTRRATA